MGSVLILGAGFAGCTAAHLLSRKGYEVTVLDAEKLAGGGCRTHWYGGHPYTLGPRLFFSTDEEVISLLGGLIEIRQFYNKTWSYVADDDQFYNYPIFAGDIERMPDRTEIERQLQEREGAKPKVNNFENYWLDAIGPNLYGKFIDSYSKKMWDIESNKSLSADFAWVNRGTPIRKTDTRLYGDMFQGYPAAPDGYNGFFDRALAGSRLITECLVEGFDAGRHTVITNKGQFKADIIINTLYVDSLFGNVFGPLKYSGRTMMKIVLPIKQALPEDIVWIHYSGKEPFTRVTEFKKITMHESDHTLLGLEIPDSIHRHYPVQSDVEKLRFSKYRELFPADFFSIGRLGSFLYKGIPDVMRDAIETVKAIG